MRRRTQHERISTPHRGRPVPNAWPLDKGEEPPLAAHLVAPRRLYAHHGLYVGCGRVVHYGGLANGLARGPVEEVSLERFARGYQVWVLSTMSRFDQAVVIDRARSRLGENRYRLLSNNCEHFANGASAARAAERRSISTDVDGTVF